MVVAMVVWGAAFWPAPAHAQTWDEIFAQKKTQKKYLLKQIAYLRLYADQAWKGYKVVSSGLETIKDLTSGEFSLHEAFLSALGKVSSLVRKDYRVAEIVSMQISISSSFGALAKSSASFGTGTKEYLDQVKTAVMDECGADLSDLLDIVLSGKLEMDDAERLARLAKLHSSMKEKAMFARWFCGEAQLLEQSMELEKLDLEGLRRLYEKN